MPAPTLADYASHSPYSDPGRYADLVAAVSPDAASLRRTCTAVVHYRSGATLSPEQQQDIDRRWLESVVAAAVERSGTLAGDRAADQLVAGCCRDHTLLTVGVLRSHKVPARSRVGFARYFDDSGFGGDHVIAERWDGARWRRFDPELGVQDRWGFDPEDIPAGPDSPFLTSAEAWLAIRSGKADPMSFGIRKDDPEDCGPAVVRDYVLREVAHRHRDELLLWDFWGPMLSFESLPAEVGAALRAEAERTGFSMPGAEVSSAEFDAIADELAYLLVAADAGDEVAAQDLAELYHGDPRLRAGDQVVTVSPLGRGGVTDLAARTTGWRSAATA